MVRELYFSEGLSCAELSKKLDKSIPFTAKILGDLMENDWVLDSGYAISSGGRRPVVYSLRENVLYVVAVSMDQFVTRISIMNMKNEEVSAMSKVDLPLADNPSALQELITAINSVVQRSGISRTSIAGVGIGMPGFIDIEKGINYSFFDLEGGSISESISAHTGLPVFIDNDSSLIALAEHCFGAARGVRNAMIINIGWGIGLGMVLEGRLFRGNNGFAGEFSHIPIFMNGRLCSCGKRGCLETESSLQYVVEKAREGLLEGRQTVLPSLDGMNIERATETVMNAAQGGDMFTIELLTEAGYTIGRGVAILIHILNPSRIILSGRGSLAGRIWQAPVQQAINEHCIPKLADHTNIETSTLGYRAELLGAVSLVMDRYDREPGIRNILNDPNDAESLQEETVTQ